MSVYVDPVKEWPRGMVAPGAARYGVRWCHLWADSEEELYHFACDLRLKPGYFQNTGGFPHFDLTPRMRTKAVALGAKEVHLIQFLKSKKLIAGGGA